MHNGNILFVDGAFHFNAINRSMDVVGKTLKVGCAQRPGIGSTEIDFTRGWIIFMIRGQLTIVQCLFHLICFFFQAEDGIRVLYVTGVQTCALPISASMTTGDRRSASEAASGATTAA